MSIARDGCAGCVLSDGRFAVFGGEDINTPYPHTNTRSCEALTLNVAEGWDPLPPMLEARSFFACVAVGGCVIVAGGRGSVTVEVYEERLRRWRRLPCNLPHDDHLSDMGSALM